MVEITAAKQNVENRMTRRNEDSLTNLWDSTKCVNIHIIEIPEGEERKEGPPKSVWNDTAENFPNMGKETVDQVQEA